MKCVVCSRFSKSHAVFRLLCIFCWVKFVLCRSPWLYLCFTSQFDPDGFRQPHQQPVIALSANCTYHPQDISNRHANRDLTNTRGHTHTHIQNDNRTFSFIIHSGPNYKNENVLIFPPFPHTTPCYSLLTLLLKWQLAFSHQESLSHQLLMSSRAIRSLLGEAMGEKDLLPWRREKTTTFNFPREIIYSCLYWALLKGEKKIGRENCSVVETICCYGTNGWEVTGFEMEGPFYLVTAPISEQPTFLLRPNVVYTSTLGFVQAVFRFVGA